VTDALADTSVFIAEEQDRPMERHRVPAQLSVSIVTVGELRAGVLVADDAEDRGQRLRTLEVALGFDPLPIDQQVAEVWARLRVQLRQRGRRMPVNDSWIAATAMALGIPVVTQDDDYAGIDGLEVIRV